MSKITCNVFRSLLGRYFECDALYRLFQSCIGKATSWPCIILLSNRLVVSGYLAVSCCSVKWKVVSVTLSLYLSQIVLQWNLRDIYSIYAFCWPIVSAICHTENFTIQHHFSINSSRAVSLIWVISSSASLGSGSNVVDFEDISCLIYYCFSCVQFVVLDQSCVLSGIDFLIYINLSRNIFNRYSHELIDNYVQRLWVEFCAKHWQVINLSQRLITYRIIARWFFIYLFKPVNIGMSGSISESVFWLFQAFQFYF